MRRVPAKSEGETEYINGRRPVNRAHIFVRFLSLPSSVGSVPPIWFEVRTLRGKDEDDTVSVRMSAWSSGRVHSYIRKREISLSALCTHRASRLVRPPSSGGSVPPN